MAVDGIRLPVKPDIDKVDFDDDKAVMKYQEESQRYNRILTMITQQKSEEATTKANMDKARHDAIMAIVSNIK